MKRGAAGLVAALLLILAMAGPVAADPAGPTEYLTVITSVEPPSDAIAVTMIGGDSFFQITQLRPVNIDVTGYRGEPYLRIRANGVVEQNQRAPTTYLNEERYGTNEIVPEAADPDADPQWEAVADGGRYAWHDHRSHWMADVRPPGAGVGDVVLEAVIPIVVDGETISVAVRSTLEPGPGPVPALAGTVAGLALIALVCRSGWIIPALVPAVAVLVAGVVAVRSVPAETGPPLTLWLPPLIALGLLVVAVVVGDRTWNPLLVPSLILLAGLQMLIWAWLSRDALGAPILPTQLPWAVHRAVVAAAIVTGLGLLVVGARRVWMLLTGEIPPHQPVTA